MHRFTGSIWSNLLIFNVDTVDFSLSAWDPNLVNLVGMFCCCFVVVVLAFNAAPCQILQTG